LLQLVTFRHCLL